MGPVQRIKSTCNSRTKNNILISSRKIESDNKWNVLRTDRCHHFTYAQKWNVLRTDRCQHFTYAQKWNVLRTERCQDFTYAQKWNVLRTDRCQHCTYAQKWNGLRTDAVNTWHMLRSRMSTTNANAHHKVYYYIFYMASL